MSQDNTTDATRPDAIEHDATNTTDETMVLSVADAAELLDVSTGAIRKRLERGQLHGRKIAGQWRVVLTKADVDANATDATDATRPKIDDATRHDTTDQTDTTRHDRTGLVASDQAQQMAALVASIQAPLLDRIEAAVARAVIAEQERDELRRQLAEAPRFAPPVMAPDFSPTVGENSLPPAELFNDSRQSIVEPESSQSDDVGLSATISASLRDESKSDPFEGHRGRFARWWDAAMGR